MEIPQLGNHVPRRGNLFSRWLGKAVLQALGWRLELQIPNIPKAVLIAAPHTSNWDFVVGMAAILAVGIRIHWLGKDSLFRGAFAFFFHWMGGMPVDRSSAHGVVVEIDTAFRQRDQLFLALAPEGTRGRSEWKLGFYYIAKGAHVPIVPAYLDHRRRVIGTSAPLEPTDDMQADLAKLRSLYSPGQAKYPERFTNL